MANMVKFGPMEMRGMIWDEGGTEKCLQILISHGNNAINSIQFVYVEDKKVICSKVHGEPNGVKLDVVTFDYPKEYLTSISGLYSNDRLVSISFGTSIQKYGPFGKADDVNYDDDDDDVYSKFVYNFKHKSSFGGFHGSVWNSCVHAIGIYVKPLGSETESYIRSLKVKMIKALNCCKINGIKIASKYVGGF